MQNDYQTPLKSQNGLGDGASTIAHGLTDNKGMVQSKIQHRQDQASEKTEQQRIIDSLQNQIIQIGQELQALFYEMKKQTDQHSQNSLNMQHRRSELKKRLIDLNYQHKSIFARRFQQIRRFQQQEKEQTRRQFEQKQRQRKQQRQQRQRQRKEQLDRYEQEYRQKLRATFQTSRLNQSNPSQKVDVSEKPSQQNQSQTAKNNNQQSNNQQEKGQTSNSNNVQDQLARSRRRLRIAEIQAQLAESRLRRSRVGLLTSELQSLRYSYLDPYYVYRPYASYALPSYYYPYSSYPTYSRWWLY